MKEWEDWTEKEKRAHNKKVRNNNIRDILNFVIGLLTFLIMAAGCDYIGKAIFKSSYFGFLGAVMFFGILLWHNKIKEAESKEKSDKIEEEKKLVLNELNEIDKRIAQMYENGEIELDIAKELKTRIEYASQKTQCIDNKWAKSFYDKS